MSPPSPSAASLSATGPALIGPQHPLEGGEPVHRQFSAQARRTPEAVAVETEGQSLTYAQLDRRSNQLAALLRTQGVGAGDLVAIQMHRSAELVVALLGTLKAGAAYVPFDPDYPADRLRYMFEDCRARVLISHPLADGSPRPHGAILIDLGHGYAALEGQPDSAPPVELDPEALAYVLYTSGSTGKPKGAMIPHRALLNHMRWMQAEFPLGAGDAVLQKTPFSFDASVWEFYAPLLAGARLVMARPGGHRDLAYLLRTLREKQISVLQVVPSLLELLVGEGAAGLGACHGLKRVFCGGEALAPRLVDRFFEVASAELINLYGPTEACIDTVSWRCRRGERRERTPIGTPVHNTSVFILDAGRSPVPAGEEGELWLGGASVGLGYWGQPALTTERFLPHPSGLLYRTGDRVRLTPAGELEFLGRMDSQVKLHGFRIELGEIEAALAQDSSVERAVVLMREDVPGEPRLVAYLIPRAGPVDPEALRTHLRGLLPGYMVPEALVELRELPRLPNGKLDRAALPAPTLQAPTAAAAEEEGGPLANVVAGVFREVLGVQQVGLRDNFFDLGGHSLKAMIAVNRLNTAFDREFPLELLFDSPTIAELVPAIERELAGAGAAG